MVLRSNVRARVSDVIVGFVDVVVVAVVRLAG
jgi:hypothetical protein